MSNEEKDRILAELAAEEAGLRTDLEKETSAVETIKAEIEENGRALEEARAQGDATAAALEREKARKEAADRELAAVRTELAAAEAERSRLASTIEDLQGVRPVCVSIDGAAERTVLLAVRLRSVAPPPVEEPPLPEEPPPEEMPAGPEPRPEPDEAFPAIPEDADLPPVGDEPIEWAFSAFRRGDAVVVPAEALASPDAPPIYFVGDLHGDSSSLRSILKMVFTGRSDSRLVFLGDLFDRGPKSIEAIRLFLWAARAFPDRLLWLRGNHDELGFDEASGRFTAVVDPHDFVDWLNERPEFRDEGVRLANLMGTLPLAAVIGPVWASHGGIPQKDVCGDFAGFDAPLPVQIRQDFVWSRMKDARSKIPNRSHKGAEVGFAQAEAFVARLRETEGVDVRHIVCAHQHEHSAGFGYCDFARYFKSRPTCQCICSFHDDDMGFDPVVLRWRAGGMPVPIRFPRPS